MKLEDMIDKQNKMKNELTTSEYFTNLCEKVSKIQQPNKKLEKIECESINVPKFNEAENLLTYNYNVQQLKLFAKTYKLKVTGNKTQLVSRIYSFLYLSNLITKIQKIIRGNIQRKYNKFHGPAFKNRTICTNNFDFLSMGQLTEIPSEQFFSFKDDDGFIYGFDLLSLHNLIYKCNGAIKNPFNNKPIHAKVIEDLRSLLRLSHILNINIITEIEDVNKDISNKKSIELRAVTLFQNIDALGNYSDSKWFLTLNRNQLIKFVRELADIWSYRAPLTIETKRAICPPQGNPFSRMPNIHVLHNIENLDELRKTILDVIEKFVITGIDKDSKYLGASYVLSALTLVNIDAATALPWLYQAVCYM
jgi:hypothetical protein